MLEQRPTQIPETTQAVVLDATDRIGLGNALSTLRHARRMTHRDLEVASGVPQGKISRIERGQSHPAVVTIAQLAEALDATLWLRIES